MKRYLAIIAHPRIYLLGRREAFSMFGMTYDHPYTLRSIAYDMGRKHEEKEVLSPWKKEDN